MTTQDGERGLPLPLEVEVLATALKVFIRDPEASGRRLKKNRPEIMDYSLFQGPYPD